MENTDKSTSLTFYDFVVLVARYWIFILAFTLLGTIAFSAREVKKYKIASIPPKTTASAAEYTLRYDVYTTGSSKFSRGELNNMTVTLLVNAGYVTSVIRDYPALVDFNSYRGSYTGLSDDDFYTTVVQKNLFDNKRYTVSQRSNSISLTLKTTKKDEGEKFLQDLMDRSNEFLNQSSATQGVTYLTSYSDIYAYANNTADPGFVAPSKKKTMLYCIASLVGSFIVALIIVTIFDGIKNSIRNPEIKKALSKDSE